MKDLLEFIVTNLVTNPEAVSIDERSEDGNVELILSVDPNDMGLIIGKNGQTIRAIRKLLTVRAIAENVRVDLQLVEPEGGKPTTNTEEPSKEDVKEPEANEKIAASVDESTSSQ